MVDTVLETWDVAILSDDILVNTCWPFWSTNPPWSAVKIWENGDFGHISCCTTGNIGQHVLTKVVLTKSMMHQLSKTVSNVSQLFLDHFITFWKKKMSFLALECPFEIIGFTCWPAEISSIKNSTLKSLFSEFLRIVFKSKLNEGVKGLI